jgi:AraC-like DNA-binding protein
MTAPAAVFRTFTPRPELRPYVHAYMWFTFEGQEPERTVVRTLSDGTEESRFSSADPLLNRMLAGGCQTLSFNFGDPWTAWNGARYPCTLRSSWVTGATTRPGLVEYGRAAGALGVLFRSTMAHAFLRAPADELTDRLLPLDELWGKDARSLEAQLAEAPTAKQKIRTLEKEFLRRLRAARRIDSSLEPLAQLVWSERGGVSVKWLSEKSGLSRQHLRRKFRQLVGVSPKLFCRAARFHALVNQVYLKPRVDWADAAAELGYYDQAHLISEFKEFTGLTPTEFFRPRAEAPALAAD